MPDSTDKTRHYVIAPNRGICNSSSILGVWLSENEEVIWIMSSDGKYVVGYNIIARTGNQLYAR